MKSDKELFRLARQHTMLIDFFRKNRIDEEEFKEEIDKIEKTILDDGYDIDKFVEYKKMYKRMTIEECQKFIKELDQLENTKVNAMIYLKENDSKAAQRLFCYVHASECNYEVIGETTNLEEINNCDIVLVASASVFTRNSQEYYNIKKELEEKRIKIDITVNDDNAERYLDLITKEFKNDLKDKIK